jgi:hypothetical protein
MAGELDVVLREEIMACQQARADLVRWKLILIAGVGSAGVGLLQAGMAPAPALLALIPLICVYVDAVCLHNDSRIMMIARFMLESAFVSDAARDYELMCQRDRHRFYSEWAVLFVSSAGLSALVLATGVLAATGSSAVAALSIADPIGRLLMVSGVIGLVATASLVYNHWRMQRGQAPKQILPTPQPPADATRGPSAAGPRTA